MNILEIMIASLTDIDKLLPAFKELRPHRTEDEIRQLFSIAFQEGYKVAYIGDATLAYSVLGFRPMTTLFSGHMLYIDDLITLSDYKKKGYAGSLFEWIKKYAKENNYEYLALNSGFQRQDAYRFYLNQGLVMDSIRFRQKVSDL